MLLKLKIFSYVKYNLFLENVKILLVQAIFDLLADEFLVLVDSF